MLARIRPQFYLSIRVQIEYEIQIKFIHKMRAFDEKWVTTLKNVTDDLPKKYKAFVNIKKYCRENDEPQRYRHIINEHCRHIFQIVTDKLARLRMFLLLLSI